MPRVTSRDGTSIAYERHRSGPAVFLVGGGLDDGAERGSRSTGSRCTSTSSIGPKALVPVLERFFGA
jgi:hypothetical protein